MKASTKTAVGTCWLSPSRGRVVTKFYK